MFLYTVYTVLGLNPGRQEYNVSPTPEQDVFRFRAVLVQVDYWLDTQTSDTPLRGLGSVLSPFPQELGCFYMGMELWQPQYHRSHPSAEPVNSPWQHFCLVGSVLGKNSTGGVSLNGKRLLPHETIDVYMRNIFILLLPL